MRLLILSCNTGEGHNSTAKAIIQAAESDGAVCEMKDALSYWPAGTNSFICGGHVFLYRNAPELFGSCESPESARLAVRTNLFLVKRIAAEAVRECGSQDDVRVHFGYESAPVRRYGAYTFPADDYLTLRVDIGKADGRNWWCVLYPPLCLAGATAENAKKSGKNSDVTLERDVFLSCGFSEKQLDALKNASEESDKSDGKPVVRSALLDFFCKLAG